jgi:DNA-binding transcriptional ArsR family regulator
MTSREQQRLIMKAEIFKAMGQPIRLAIIELLNANEMQVGRIAAQLETGAPNVSKHLALLLKHGLVVERKEGSKIFYRGTAPQLMGFIWCVEGAIRRRLDTENTADTATLGCGGTASPLTSRGATEAPDVRSDGLHSEPAAR